jgi:hypothetical protein
LVHYITIHCALERAGISHKKLKKVVAERLMADFIGCIMKYKPEELCFLDKTLKDERTLTRMFGQAKKGQRTK